MPDNRDNFIIKNFTRLQVEINRMDANDEHVELSDRDLSFKYCIPIHAKPSVVAAELRTVAQWLDKMQSPGIFEAAVDERLERKKLKKK